MFAEDQPVGFDRFVGVERIFPRRRFAPPRDAIRISFDEKDSAMLDLAKAGFKWRQKPQMNFAERDFAQEHYLVGCRSVHGGIRKLQAGDGGRRLEDIIRSRTSRF